MLIKIFLRKNKLNFSSIKILEMKINNNKLNSEFCNKTKFTFIFLINKNNIYTMFNFFNINNRLLLKNIISNSKLINNNYYSSLNNLCYFIVFKFKLLGRHYKIKKKTNKIIVCSLNYSHKIFLINVLKFNFFKWKKKRNRLIYYSPFNLNLNQHLIWLFKKLRQLNFYTNKGVKNMNSCKLKRIGKSKMS